MIIPIRCFTCNKVLADKYMAYRRMIEEEGKTAKEALDALDLERMCCRRHMLTHVDLITKI